MGATDGDDLTRSRPSDAGGDAPPPSESTRVDLHALAPAFFGVLFLTTLGALLYLLSDYVADAALAFVLASMFGRVYKSLRARLGGRAYVASGLTTGLAFVSIVAPLVGLGWTMIGQARGAYARIAELVGGPEGTTLDVWIQSWGLPLSKAQIAGAVELVTGALRSLVIEQGGALVGNVLGLVVHLTIILVILFYVLVDGERLRTWVYDFSPLPDEEDALIEQTFKNVSRGVVYGNGLGSLLQGVLGGLAMWIAGFHSALLWGAVMSVFAFLPIIGITLVTIPATVVLLLEHRVGAALTFFVFCTAQGLFIENVVKTRLMGSAMRMHDLLVFLSVLGGISTFGLIGVIYGPLCAMLFITLSDLYVRHYRPQLARRLARRSRTSTTPSPR